MPANTNNPFMGYLNETPAAGYYSFLYSMNLTPNQRLWGQNAQSDFYNQYQGALGNQIKSGQQPTLEWTDFLNGLNFQQQFADQTQFQRQAGMANFNPRTSFRYL